jgi:hypothetical protein
MAGTTFEEPILSTPRCSALARPVTSRAFPLSSSPPRVQKSQSQQNRKNCYNGQWEPVVTVPNHFNDVGRIHGYLVNCRSRRPLSVFSPTLENPFGAEYTKDPIHGRDR